MPRVLRPYWIALVLLVSVLPRTAVAEGTSLAIDPALTVIAPGQEFTVDIVVPAAGTPINGYDAVVGFDPARLELLLPTPRSLGEGALFTDACAQRFLNVAVRLDSTAVTVSHVLLCAGTSVAGPGITYELRFRAREIIGDTHLQLLEGTAAYDAGAYVTPFTSSDAVVRIGDPVAAPPATPRSRELIAVPNPFNPRTELRFESTEPERIRLEVFDLAGRAIDTLYDGHIEPGPFRLTWDALDRNGRRLSSGVYLARLTTSAGFTAITRLVLVR